MGSLATVEARQGELDLGMLTAPTMNPDRCSVPPVVSVAGRSLQPTTVFDTYWRFAARRQAIYQARLTKRPGPWTDDPVLRRHRFTNCYRAADRVSQFLIRNVSYSGAQDANEVVFRTLLFKMFNRVSTWELLRSELGEISWADFDRNAYDKVLTRAHETGAKLYSAAYVVPPPRLGEARKHSNHLRLLQMMMEADVARRIGEGGSLRAAFETLRSFPAMGDFLAYQFAIDLNYSAAVNFDEMEFVVPGPGARDGIRKCFGRAADGIEAEIIAYMADRQREHFERLGLDFTPLGGRRSLQLIDCQNLFCEVDKYARVVHPDVAGRSGRTRIKQSFAPVAEPVSGWFPPKWGLQA